MLNKNLIDVHVHMAAFPDGKNGCLMSPAFKKSATAWFIKWKMGLDAETPEEMNRQYVERLVADIEGSSQLSHAVVLAFDGVYDEKGELDQNRTTCLISNDYVAGLVSAYPRHFLLGASINPQRRDALDELDRVQTMGARLIKVLPNSHAFDPSDKKYIPFYRALAEKKIPLLSHVGHEHSFTPYHQEYGFPDRLRRPLDEGALVIGAHACSSAIFLQKKYYRVYVDFMRRYPNFYVDLAALTLPPSAGMIPLVRRHPEFFDRFLFGTDYPLSAFATTALGRVSMKKQWELWRMKNTFDKQVAVLDALGLRAHNQTTQQLLKVREG